MRGSITSRGKNSYRIIISLGNDPATGKLKQYTETVRGTRKQAEQRRTEILYEIDKGTFINPDRITLGEFLEQWFNDHVIVNLAPGTIEGYRTVIYYRLIPALGNVRLRDLKPGHLKKYYADCLAEISAQTVRKHHALLHKALNTAVEWEIIAGNVCDRVSPPSPAPVETNFWTAKEVSQFLTIYENNEYFPMFHTILNTGLRRSELLGLRWADVDFIMCQLSVRRALHYKRKQFIYRQNKSKYSTRTIALTPGSVRVLRNFRDYQDNLRYDLSLPPVKENDNIFMRIDGEPFRPDSLSHAWDRLVKQSGLPVIRLHDARHTHASILLQQGIHPKVVQERLGHSSIAITLDIYSHITPGMQQEAADVFEKAIMTNS